MTPGREARSPRSARIRAQLAARLGERRREMERAAMARLTAVSPSGTLEDPEYVTGLRAAVLAALDFGIASVEGEAEGPPAVPDALLAQVRRAARSGVALEIVLRRLFAGYALLGDFVVQELEAGGPFPDGELNRVLRTEASLFDQVVVTVSEEYAREAARRSRTTEQRRSGQVRRLLAGELLDPDLDYELDGWHLGVIAVGPDSRKTLRDLAAALDRRLLTTRPGGESVWSWLGGRHRLTVGDFLGVASSSRPAGVTMAVGEPASGLAGWRLTHRQAKAALPVALGGNQAIVSYADVPLLASALRDDLLASSLSDLYLKPLAQERDGGVALRQTLRAYLSSGRNVSSASSALGLSRQTVNARLRRIEERIGRQIDSCTAEVETALRLCDLQQHP